MPSTVNHQHLISVAPVGVRLSAERQFWLARLTGITEITSLLPDAGCRPSATGGEFARSGMTFSPDVAERLVKVARGSPLLTFTVMLAALCAYLRRTSRGAPIVVGTPVLKEAALRNAVTFSLDVHERASFREVLETTRANLIEIYSNQHYPLEQVARDLGRDQARHELFALSAASTALHGHTPRLETDLALVLSDEGGALNIEGYYQTNLYRRSTVDRLLAHVHRIIDSGLRNPDCPIAELTLLTGDERRQLVEDWNLTSRDIDEGSFLHTMFEEQAARLPDATAVRWDDRQVTYGDLDAAADSFAARLRGDGVGVEDRVGLYLDRSPELVVGILGTLKAGAAYVPLDRAYPEERLRYISEDAELKCVIVRSRATRPPWWSGPTVELSTLAQGELRPVRSTAKSRCDARSLAYVLYTSGSTGKPKGVAIEHGSLSNYLHWAREAYRTTEGAGSPVHTTVGFDLTVTSLLVPLVSGKAVDLIDESRGLAGLSEALRGNPDYSLVKLTPAHLEVLKFELADHLGAQATRVLVIGGEALRAEMVTWWRRRAGDARIVNEYGPTETVVGCCAHEIAADSSDYGAVPIGRPIANAAIYVLDDGREPVPVGLVGELYVGGLGVGRGYVRRPALTAEYFVPDHLSGRRGARLYRTGDLGRWRDDGTLEYCGRRDAQVKVRGYRIELSEVESALRQQNGVKEAAVAAADGRLVGYVVWERPDERNWSRLQEALTRELPGYMVPTAWRAMTSLPLSANGKLDRARLPAAADAREIADADRPRNETETVIASVWCEVLARDRVGIHDNFFELGGHSLLGTRLVSRLREAFPVEVPLRWLFEAPTVSEFAALLRDEMHRGDAVPTAPIQRVSRDQPLPLSFAQEQLWWHEQLFSDTCTYNIPVAVRLRAVLDTQALDRSVNEIVCRHEVLRTTYEVQDGRPVQIIAPELRISIATHDVSRVAEAARERSALDIISDLSMQPVDLARGPVVRACLIRLADDDHMLGFVIHHIASDAWSVPVMARELGECYRAFSSGLAPRLPDLLIQYADYSHWQRRTDQHERMAASTQYWARQLAGSRSNVTFPPDRARLSTPRYRGKRISYELAGETLAAIRRLSQRCHASTFMTLLAVFNVLLRHFSGESDLSVGTAIVNRDAPEVEHLIGCFTNTLVIRTDLSENQRFFEVVRRVREITLAAFAHRHVPFGRVVQAVNPRRDPRYQPFFQVMFTHRLASPASLLGPGLAATPLRPEAFSAKCDLTCHVLESGAAATVTFEYNADLYEDSTASHIASSFARIAAEVTANADVLIDDTLSARPTPITVDEARLESLAALSVDRDEARREAPTSLERTITDIWRDVLRKTSIDPEENFFDAGGHSLLLIAVAERLRERTGLTVSLLDLFRYTTIKSLARRLSADSSETHASSGRPRAAVEQRVTRRRTLTRRRRSPEDAG